MAVRTRLTVEQYLALPEEKPYLEFIDGEAVPKSMPNLDHGDLVRWLMRMFMPLFDMRGAHGGPEVRIQFDTAEGLQFRLPDFSYWAPGRPRKGARAALPPTLAVEVVSPDETVESQREKCHFYRAHGVDVAWLFDPASRTAEAWDGAGDGEIVTSGTLTSPVLPGVAIDLRELFAVLDED